MTRRLALNRLRPVDTDAFQTMTNAPAVTAAVDLLATPFTRADAERLIAGKGDGRDTFLGLRLRETSELVGAVGTHLVGTSEIEIGYWLAPAYQRRGYASEAVAAVVGELAVAYPARRIFAECQPQNVPSWRLLQRLGFTPDGAQGRRSGRMRLALQG